MYYIVTEDPLIQYWQLWILFWHKVRGMQLRMVMSDINLDDSQSRLHQLRIPYQYRVRGMHLRIAIVDIDLDHPQSRGLCDKRTTIWHKCLYAIIDWGSPGQYRIMTMHLNMYITMCLYIIITIMLWVLYIYSFIKHYTIIILC